MAFTIYKPGQGKYTRLSTAAGAGALTAWGASWVWKELENLQGRMGDNTIFVQAGVIVAIFLAMGGLMWWLLNRPNICDFMIATEAEMRKVNWPSRKELVGSTWIVICGTAIMACLLFAINLGFGFLFTKIGILAGG